MTPSVVGARLLHAQGRRSRPASLNVATFAGGSPSARIAPLPYPFEAHLGETVRVGLSVGVSPITPTACLQLSALPSH